MSELTAPTLTPASAPYPYQPVEETYTLPVGAWTATWQIRRLSTGEVLATVNADPALERYASGVTFYFDADGKVTNAYGYGTGRLKNRQLKLPNRKGTAVYHEQAALVRRRLLDEPVRPLPVLARNWLPDLEDTTRLLLLDESRGEFELFHIKVDQPTDLVYWRGYDLPSVLRDAIPTREDFLWEFYDPRARDAWDALVLAPQREERRVAALTAQACADIAAVPEGQKALLHRMRAEKDHAPIDREDVEEMAAVRALEANGWVEVVLEHDYFHDPRPQFIAATVAGRQVLAALRVPDDRERARHPFEHTGFQSGCSAALSPDDWKALFDRPQVPLVTQTRPMFGGTTVDYTAWLATLTQAKAEAAEAFRAAVLSAAGPLHVEPAALNAVKRAYRQWDEACVAAVEAGGEIDTTRVSRRALMGLEHAMSGDMRPTFPPLRPWHKVKRFEGGLPPRKPTPRQRAALEWPVEAKEDFPGWLTRMAAQPADGPADTAEAVLRKSDLWQDWHGRQTAIIEGLEYLEEAGARTPDGRTFDAHAWLREQGWSWTRDSIGDALTSTSIPHDLQRLPPDGRPSLTPLTDGEKTPFKVMAGQALGQVLDLDSADYWTAFSLVPFSGKPDIILESQPIVHGETAAETEPAAPPPPEPVIVRGTPPGLAVDAIGLYLAGPEALAAWIEPRAAEILAVDPALSEVQARILAGGDLAAYCQDQGRALAERVEALLATPEQIAPQDAQRYNLLQEKWQDKAPMPNSLIVDITGDRAILDTIAYMRQHGGRFAAKRPAPPAAPVPTPQNETELDAAALESGPATSPQYKARTKAADNRETGPKVPHPRQAAGTQTAVENAPVCTLRSTGFGFLELKNGGAPVTLTWMGGDDLQGDPQAVACTRRLFARDLQKRRPSKVWTATAKDTAPAA